MLRERRDPRAMRTLFLTSYDRTGSSSRYLVHNYLEFYEQAGMECAVSPLFDDRYLGFGTLDRPTGIAEVMRHFPYYLSRVLNRLRHVLTSSKFDLVVFEKELLPYFPYGLEALLRRLQSKTIVLLDDATYVYYRQHPYRLVRFLCRHKIERIMGTATHVIVWNEQLARYARQFNTNVSVVNSGIDLRRYRIKPYQDGRVTLGQPTVIGWIGAPALFPYIRALEDAFRELSSRYEAEFHVISTCDYVSRSIRTVNKRWSIETEVDDLQSLDIGVMPLPDDEWTRGKSGVKAVQYMGVGVPVVSSAVGTATDLIQDGVNGFLATSTQDWVDKLGRLIESPTLRREMGLRGRQTVETTYSIQAVAPRLIKILQQVGTGN